MVSNVSIRDTSPNAFTGELHGLQKYNRSLECSKVSLAEGLASTMAPGATYISVIHACTCTCLSDRQDSAGRIEMWPKTRDIEMKLRYLGSLR